MSDLTGQRFGFLTVLSRGDNYYSKTGKAYTTWLCRCDCGVTKTVMQCSLVTGHTKSCGCFRRQKMAREKTVHGGVGTKLYNSWRAMKERCLNPNSEHYAMYGGRGITMCEEWLDFDTFRTWAVNNGYVEGLTIDRIDVNGNYCPENCRWSSAKEQGNNKRNNRIICVRGIEHTLSEWSDISGVPKATISSRIDRYGWDVYRAVFHPVRNSVKSEGDIGN